MDYFFGGGLKRIRDKAIRRQHYQHCADSAKQEIKILNDSGNHGVQTFNNCAEHMNAEFAVVSALSAGSSFTM